MRILITTGIFTPEAGGPASYAETLANKLVASGNNVKVITYSDQKSYAFDSSYNFSLTRIVRSNKIFNYSKYFLAVLKSLPKYDFVYCLDHSSAGWPVFLATRIIRKKYIVRVGGDFLWEKYVNSGSQPVTLQDFYHENIYKKYNKLFQISKTILQSANFIIFNSNRQLEIFSKYYDLKLDKISTIYNPIPDFNYNLKRSEPEKIIVYFGRLIKVKNLTNTLKAFAKLSDKDFKFLIIGNGPEKNNLKNLVKQLDLETRVNFLPALSGEELWQQVINSYLVILPSWTDISPNQVYECLYFGVPVLLTQENYLPLDTSSWLKIDPHSVDDLVKQMNDLLNSEKYNVFVNNQKQFDLKMNWDDVTKEHLELFKKLV